VALTTAEMALLRVREGDALRTLSLNAVLPSAVS
jgi:hypothetical protein